MPRARASRDVDRKYLCGCATAIAIGVWRVVRFLGKLLEYAQGTAYDDDDAPVSVTSMDDLAGSACGQPTARCRVSL
jgi:hypothetical protein